MTVMVDGEALAQEKKKAAKARCEGYADAPTLAIVASADAPAASRRFVERKRDAATEVGVRAEVVYEEADPTPEALKRTITELADDPQYHGIVVQLPIPGIDDADTIQDILNTVPSEKDVDVLSQEAFDMFARGTFPLLPPVAGAVAAIVAAHDITLTGKRIGVMGSGRLVGKPVYAWCVLQGNTPTVIDRTTSDIPAAIRACDILITGIGRPGYITSDMIKEGAVLIDAGTTFVEGTLHGDIAPESAEKASVFTPVPGGVGPITVAILFENLITLWERYHSISQ